MPPAAFPSPDLPPATARELSAVTTFARNRLNRHSERREIEAELAKLRENPLTRAFIIVEDTPLLRAGGDSHGARFTLREVAQLGEEIGHARESAYLGTLDDTPLFAMLLPASAREQVAARAEVALIDVALADLRTIAAEGLVSIEDLGPLGEAKALMDWHRRHGFCANCGAPTKAFTGGFRRDCQSCGAQHFPRVDPVVIMLVTDGENCLLGRQPRFSPGMYSALAGYVEPGETIEDAVRREIMEEAGVPVGAVRYLASQPWPFPSSLMIGCFAEALATPIVIDRLELEDARWFSREEARLMLAGDHPAGLSAPRPVAIAHHLLREFVGAESGGT